MGQELDHRQAIRLRRGRTAARELLFFWNVKTYLHNAGLEIDKTQSCCYQWFLLPGVDPAKLRTPYFSSKMGACSRKAIRATFFILWRADSV